MINTLKTTLLLASLMGVLMLVGNVVGGQAGVAIAFLVGAAMNAGVYWFSDTYAVRSAHAVPVAEARAQLGREIPDWLEADVALLAKEAGIPRPRVYVSPEPSPNAFATGRSPDKGLVCVTRGILSTLDRRQLRGVLAHELGHIKHRDTLVSTVAATLAGAIGMLATMARWAAIFGGRGRDDGQNPFGLILVALLAPLVAGVIHMAVSRTREYAADARAAELTGDPEALAQALERIAGRGAQVPMHTGSEATHYIANNFRSTLGGMFSTHPPMEERVRRLRAMGGAHGRVPVGSAFPAY